MLPKNRIQKGKRGENVVCERIERMGLGSSCRTPGSGSGKKKGDVFNNLPFLLEVKNHKSIHLQDWVRQAKEQAQKGNYDPNKWGLVIVNPEGVQDSQRMELWFVCELDEALELMKRNQEPKIKEPDRNLRYKLERLRQSAKDVINELE